MRVGFGYDIHRLVPGRKLFLCGVEIPFDKGLLGHSDGDAALHAVADAVLGALGKSDIGEYFPNTVSLYKDMPSRKIIGKVRTLIDQEQLSVNNVDVTIVAESPVLKPFKTKMKQTIAELLGIGEQFVSVKATTNEGVDAAGRGEAIASYAAVLLVEKK